METIIKDGRKYKLVPIDETPYRITKTVSFDFEVYPHDLPETMTYVNAVKAVEKLGDGWRIPTREELLLMYDRKDEIGGFKTTSSSGSDFPGWYWSRTEHRNDPDGVYVVQFSSGGGGWSLKDNVRLSCRPVRLVAASAPTPG